ncbi:hypothetical protein RhiirA4_485941 [Rhizophagus irregularis]|uniref:Uncharacterized protein n=1 Tax=Rhizophagus irregularis TaxID=588596 RepID=A0A2I1HQS6_9GLOM|nr:hypothetical protein RhiirA4_485941 [Rhizophagus irregularis]
MSQPQIIIDLDEELRIVCSRLLFYNIPGFYLNAKKIYRVCQEEGYSFQLQNITKWIKHQYSYQIYRQPLPCKTEAIIDVVTHFKDRCSLTSRNSLEIWIVIKDIYKDPSNPLTWPKLLITDGDAFFESLAFIKALKKRIAILTYKVQYAIEGRLTDGDKTRLIGMSPARAMTLEEVESKPSKKPKRAIGKDEKIKLQKGTAIRYLLKAGELEGDHRRRATNPY